MEDNADTINILFLDELTAAPSAIQASAYQIALDKRLGSHTLPKNTFIIGAGNRIEDGSVSFDMPSALKNRFMHFELKIDVNAWLNWARSKKINDIIIDFIEKNPTKLADSNLETDAYIIVTPRSWETLSNLLKETNLTIAENQFYAHSIIGEPMTYLLVNKDLLEGFNINDVYDGKRFKIPEKVTTIDKIVYFIEKDYPSRKEELIAILCPKISLCFNPT